MMDKKFIIRLFIIGTKHAFQINYLRDHLSSLICLFRKKEIDIKHPSTGISSEREKCSY